jgi:hypothetical protein
MVPFPADCDMVITGVPDHIADDIVRLGNAVITEGEPVAELPAEPPSWYMGEVPPGGSLPGEQQPAVPEDDEPMKRPWGNATKAAWVRWALHQDPELTAEAAGDMSKVQLMTKYGERL